MSLFRCLEVNGMRCVVYAKGGKTVFVLHLSLLKKKTTSSLEMIYFPEDPFNPHSIMVTKRNNLLFSLSQTNKQNYKQTKLQTNKITNKQPNKTTCLFL